jgi:acyl-CoA reductase-like NAD-dependent aldehyde dehydrogenase
MTLFDNYINGDWVSAKNYIPNVNPSDTKDIIGEFAEADHEQTAAAIAAAKAAEPSWGMSGIQQRFDILDFVGTELLARREELGELLAREEGKTLAEGIGEVGRAGQVFKFFAGEALRSGGDSVPSTRPSLNVEVTREPIGTVGMITPWNFPIAIPAWKIAPALAFGNCIVFKPAALVPGCAWALAEILSRAGLPDGVFNLVMGPGRVVGEAIVGNPDINAVSFTGSVATGRDIRARASARGAKVQLEMGGKNPLVILDDADIDIAVDCALQGAFFSTGQRCTASSRLIVTDGIHDQFVEALTKATSELVVGDARDSSTQIGPVVDAKQLDSDLKYVEQAVIEGGKLVCGGGKVPGLEDGFYMQPALITETGSDMTINRDEVFGPVASVIRVADYEEALKVANDCEFGLSSGICTGSLKYASDFKRRAEAGMVMVNLPTAGVDYHVPFGGRKGSSYGSREQGSYAREFYTTVKTAYTRAG